MRNTARFPNLGRMGWAGLVAVALVVWAVDVPAQRGAGPRGGKQNKIEIRTYDFKEARIKKMEYGLFVPSDYKKAKKTPLIVALHGILGNPRQILSARGFTSLAEQRGYILVAPFGYNERGGYGMPMPGARGAARGGAAQTPRGGAARSGSRVADLLRGSPDDPPNLGELSEKDVLNVLAIVRKDYNIDPNRTYLMGHSMGGGGTWHIAMKYPDDWAALGPIAPAIGVALTAGLDKIKRVPVIVIQGDNDDSVPVAGTRRWVERMKELGMTYQYIEVPGGDHGSVVAPNLPKMFDFFDKHPRQPAK